MSQIKRRIAKYFIPMQLSNVFSSTQSHSQKRYSSRKTNNFGKARLMTTDKNIFLRSIYCMQSFKSKSTGTLRFLLSIELMFNIFASFKLMGITKYAGFV